MIELTFEINSNKEIWGLLDKSVDNILIKDFTPNEVLEWWSTDLKTKSGEKLENLSVRYMKMDVQTDLTRLKNILDLNTHQLSIYQFDKVIPDTLVLDNLPEANRFQILKENGLKHYFVIDFEFITIGSFDEKFISRIETHSIFKERIIARKQLVSDQKAR